MANSETRDMTTCHASPWALIRRNGDAVGKRPSTRMAYLVGTFAPNGIAIAVTGYVMNNDLTGWTKHPRRIRWCDIVRKWRARPTKQDVRKVKRAMAVVTLADIEAHAHANAEVAVAAWAPSTRSRPMLSFRPRASAMRTATDRAAASRRAPCRPILEFMSFVGMTDVGTAASETAP